MVKGNMKKIAFITGAARGIGAGISKVLSTKGYDLALNYRSESEHLDAVVAECRANGARVELFQGDIAHVDQIEKMFEEFKKVYGNNLDLLVNNAGITRHVSIFETDQELFDMLNAVDWRGSFFCTKHAAMLMRDHGKGGVVINITSNQQKGCWPKSLVYGPVKAALMHFTETAAYELSEHNIRVVAIAPGYTHKTDSDFSDRLASVPQEHRAEAKKFFDELLGRIPMKRFCTPSEIGHAVNYLASHEARYITGTCLYMDGGALLPVVADNSYTPMQNEPDWKAIFGASRKKKAEK